MTPVTAGGGRGESNAAGGKPRGFGMVTTWLLVLALAIAVAVVVELRGS